MFDNKFITLAILPQLLTPDVAVKFMVAQRDEVPFTFLNQSASLSDGSEK